MLDRPREHDELERHPAVRDARLAYQRMLASWASDWLHLRTQGLERPRAKRVRDSFRRAA
ncbi:MAG: hypothetical protein ACF8PN_11645 [Phycisphaerales bacterium]